MKKILVKIQYIIRYILVIPHILVFSSQSSQTKELIRSDVEEMNSRGKRKKSLGYYLLMHKPYRNLYYSRVGGISSLLRLFLPPYPLFLIGTGRIGRRCFVLNHPYGTIINCKSIGDNFTVCQLTTIGNALHGRNDLVPTIGNNVSIGANVTIIGDITIGNNVQVSHV